VRFLSLNDFFCCDTKGDRDGEEDRDRERDGDEEEIETERRYREGEDGDSRGKFEKEILRNANTE
jgi:hypothetical protein